MADTQKDKKVYTYMDEGLYGLVKDEADALHRSMAGQIRYVLDKHYGRYSNGDESDDVFSSEGVANVIA